MSGRKNVKRFSKRGELILENVTTQNLGYLIHTSHSQVEFGIDAYVLCTIVIVRNLFTGVQSLRSMGSLRPFILSF
jgi:hypothetical protein